MARKFCYVCKREVEYEIRENFDGFEAHGHEGRKVSRMQRNLGRTQRTAAWQRGN